MGRSAGSLASLLSSASCQRLSLLNLPSWPIPSASTLSSSSSPPPPSYTDYLLDTLGRRELLQWLSLTPARFWHTLLFKDRCESGGRWVGRLLCLLAVPVQVVTWARTFCQRCPPSASRTLPHLLLHPSSLPPLPRSFNYLGILAEVPPALQQAMAQTPGKLTTAEGGAVMSQHAGQLALTQALLDRPAFDYCFCMKARRGDAERGRRGVHGGAGA